MPQTVADAAEAVLAHHIDAVVRRDMDAVLADYTDFSVLLTPTGAVRGLDALRAFFVDFFASMPAEFFDELKLTRRETVGDVAYIVWTAGASFPLGTDTFLVRDGRIVVQTFAAYRCP